jgi:hypothetical protein
MVGLQIILMMAEVFAPTLSRNPPHDYAASSTSSQPVKASRNLLRRSATLSAVIGSGWVDQLEIDLAQFVFFHLAVLLTKPHRSSGRLTVPLFRLTQQLRQLGDVGRDPSRLALCEQLGRRAPAGLTLEIDVSSCCLSASRTT